MILSENILFANRYLFIRMLGRGGSSEVWLANDQLSGLQVAIKVYAPGIGLDEDGVQLFSKEFNLVFNLNHPNLLRPTHYDIQERMPYLVMPYIEQGSTMKRIGEFTEKEAWRFLHDVASGLAYLHGKVPPVIHQDIKPDNVLINDDGAFLITDFGISTKMRTTLPTNPLTTGSMTMAYAAPERWSRKNRPTMAGDIWALGASVFELLTGYTPYGELGGRLQYEGAEIPEMEGDWSQKLNQIVEYCLQREPEDRPTANEIVIVCKSYLDNKSVPTEKKPVTGKQIGKATIPISKQEEIHITNPTNPSQKKIKSTKPVSRPTVIKSKPEDTPVLPTPHIPTISNQNNSGKEKIIYIAGAAAIILLLIVFFIFRYTGKPSELPSQRSQMIADSISTPLVAIQPVDTIKTGKTNNKKPTITDSTKISPTNTPDYFLDKGNESFSKGNYTEALDYYRKTGNKVDQGRLKATENCASFLKTADEFFSQQKFEEARNEYRKILVENQFDNNAKQRVKECDEQINSNSHEQK